MGYDIVFLLYVRKQQRIIIVIWNQLRVMGFSECSKSEESSQTYYWLIYVDSNYWNALKTYATTCQCVRSETYKKITHELLDVAKS